MFFIIKFSAVVLFLVLFSQISYAWRCNSTSHQLNDKSVRAVCMGNMLSHTIQYYEKSLLLQYKKDLPVINAGTSLNHFLSNSNPHVENMLKSLKLHYELFNLFNPPVKNTFITNNTAIPMTCTQSSSEDSNSD